MKPTPIQKGVVLIVGGGHPPHDDPRGEDMPDPDDGMIPVPDGFDMGDSQPGDTITVQVEARVAPDGKTLIPLSVDGHKLDPEPDEDDMPPPPDDGPSMGDKWEEMFGKR